MLDIEYIDHISEEMRAVVESEWPELAHKRTAPVPAWKKRPVMSTATLKRPGWSWTSDTIAVVIYSVLVTFLMLSWAYIPA